MKFNKKLKAHPNQKFCEYPYFAYGSNLNLKQMKMRCKTCVPIAKVMVKNAKMVFRGVADFIHEEGEEGMGAIYHITEKDLEALDIYEGFPRLYERKLIDVIDLETGEKIKAFCYVMTKSYANRYQIPTESYYGTIYQGFLDWNLELCYLEDSADQVIGLTKVRR